MSIQYKNGGTWSTPGTGKIAVSNGSSWVYPTSIKVNNGTGWVDIGYSGAPNAPANLTGTIGWDATSVTDFTTLNVTITPPAYVPSGTVYKVKVYNENGTELINTFDVNSVNMVATLSGLTPNTKYQAVAYSYLGSVSSDASPVFRFKTGLAPYVIGTTYSNTATPTEVSPVSYTANTALQYTSQESSTYAYSKAFNASTTDMWMSANRTYSGTDLSSNTTYIEGITVKVPDTTDKRLVGIKITVPKYHRILVGIANSGGWISNTVGTTYTPSVLKIASSGYPTGLSATRYFDIIYHNYTMMQDNGYVASSMHWPPSTATYTLYVKDFISDYYSDTYTTNNSNAITFSNITKLNITICKLFSDATGAAGTFHAGIYDLKLMYHSKDVDVYSATVPNSPW